MEELKEIKETVNETLKIIKDYGNLLKVRQIFYRLVSKQIIENTLNEYKYLVKHLATD